MVDAHLTPDESRLAHQLVAQALALPASERDTFMADACSTHPSISTSVMALFEAQTALRENAERDSLTDPGNGAPFPPARIGRYVIQRPLASGGMGTVFLAEQERPRRLVALKFIRPDRRSREALQYFDLEVEAQGALLHANIAGVYEAGEGDTESGHLAFIAMEYVDGMRIDDFAASKRLSLRDRLGLVIKIGRALQHAHERGVVHCDIKPGNILVLPAGEPKILDFGLALMARANIPRIDAVAGTPAYMSPEQRSGNRLTLD